MDLDGSADYRVADLFLGFKLGYLLNFNVAHMRAGIVRMVNGL
jgi:hypothetical protein